MKKPIVKSVSGLIITFTNKVLLEIIYIFGIGPTSIFSKLVGKDFLKDYQGKTSWERYSVGLEAEKMF